MGESRLHQALVGNARRYIRRTLPEVPDCFILSDSLDSFSCQRPYVIQGFIPDLFVDTGEVLVIGEAKTPDDVERKHSVDQYNSFLKECSNYNGEAYFLLSTTWDLVATAKNLLNQINSKVGNGRVRILVICELDVGEGNAEDQNV
jgi:hypothetical protein